MTKVTFQIVVDGNDASVEVFKTMNLPFIPVKGMFVDFTPPDGWDWLWFEIDSVWFDEAEKTVHVFMQGNQWADCPLQELLDDLRTVGWSPRAGIGKQRSGGKK